jgi:hypothetical protein
MTHWLFVAHIAVLGYWFGSDLIVNHVYRKVCLDNNMSFKERDQLMEHVMHLDQHVRYALILQAILGSMLAISSGFIPGGYSVLIVIALFGFFWIGFIELVERKRKLPLGKTLAIIDRSSRYILISVLIAIAIGLIGEAWLLPIWLRLKLAAFAGVIACGIGIRFVVIIHFRIWSDMAKYGVTPEGNYAIQRTYGKATSLLVLLWVFIIAIVLLSVVKPG